MARPKESNEIVKDHGEWLEIDISTKKIKNALLKIDKKSYKHLQSLDIGRISCVQGTKNNTPYAVVFINRRSFYVHKLLVSSSKEIDHINQDGLDNRLCNLRESSRSQNCANKSLQTNNTSGIKGVYWNKKQKKWHARAVKEGIRYHIGYFEELEKAKTAYDLEHQRLFKSFSLTNKEMKSVAL